MSKYLRGAEKAMGGESEGEYREDIEGTVGREWKMKERGTKGREWKRGEKRIDDVFFWGGLLYHLTWGLHE